MQEHTVLTKLAARSCKDVIMIPSGMTSRRNITAEAVDVTVSVDSVTVTSVEVAVNNSVTVVVVVLVVGWTGYLDEQ
jgi:hypothetical protein